MLARFPGMNFPPVIRRTLACACWFAAIPTSAHGEAANPPPAASGETKSGFSLREIWVPTGDLSPVLGRYPRAVSLSRDQLFSLLRDAHLNDAETPALDNPPPVQAVIRQATFEGWLALGPNGQTQVRVEGQLVVEAFSDAWTELPLGLQGTALGTAEIDDASHSSGPVVLRRIGGRTDDPASLEIQGRGVHRLRVGFILPVKTSPEGSSIALPTLTAVGEFILHLPTGARADSDAGCAVRADAGGVVATAVLRHTTNPPPVNPTAIRDFAKPDRALSQNPLPAEPNRLNWRTPPPASTETGALLQSGRVVATVDESGVTIRQEIRLRPALGRPSGEAHFTLPVGNSVSRVEGPSVGRWELGADGLHVTLVHDGESDGAAVLDVEYRLPVTFAAGQAAHLDLPVLEAAGAHRMTGELAVKRGQGITIQRIEPGAAVLPATAGVFSRSEETASDFVAGFTLADLPVTGHTAPLSALRAEARRTTTRFSVDADVRADIELDGIRIARTLAFQVEEGEMFSARIKLPAGETVLALHATKGGKEPEWRQESDDLLLNWTTGLSELSKTSLVIDTRMELVAPKPGAPTDIFLGAALVSGAERLAGYIALTSASAFRLVTTGGDDRLERRDGRTTPVRGDVAWFYRDDFRLALRVERRAAETEARFTGYALPLAGAVEIHAQIDYRFLRSGVETVKVRVPRESADAFLFTGEHIAERRRDDDVWTIRFQSEQSGDYVLGVQATIPAPADEADKQRFHFRLPAVVPLESAHWSGAWAVEANTDTEIGFAATGANEVDALHAPPLAGYQPRRRVIGVFEFLGGTADMKIDLDGVRHAVAGGAVAVVDWLDLETEASTSGVMRHRATVRARTVADGFFNLHLPAGAALWSLTLDGEPVKPVRGSGAADEVLVELPGGRNPADASKIVVVYETPGQPWTGTGWRAAVAPKFDEGVPVLHRHWTLSVPDGFEYRFADGSSDAVSRHPIPGDLLVPKIAQVVGRVAQWFYRPGRSLNEAYKAASRDPTFAQPQGRGTPSPDAPQFANPTMDSAEVLRSSDAQATLKKIVPNSTPPNASIEPKYIAKVGIVKRYPLEAQQYYDTGRFDLAFKRYEQVLALDPYNDAARRGEERVQLARKQHGDAQGYAETRGRLIGQTAQGWELPAKHNFEKTNDTSGTVAITRKLQAIVIPNIEFRSTTLSDAVEFLRQEARRLDTQSPEEERGVNIFLKLPGPSTSTPNTGIPGLPPGAEVPSQSPPVAVATGNTRITLTLSNIPLLSALDYVAKAANLKVKVEPYAVSLVPLTEETSDMGTLEIRIPPGSLDVSPTTGINGTTDVTGTGSGAFVTRMDAKSFLESSGVPFPPGSSAVYSAATSKLVIRNTQANMELVQALFATSGAPRQTVQLPLLDGRESPKGVAGLLPLRLDLPANGILYEFDGDAMGALDFHYADWAVAARWRWVSLTLGAFAFLFGAAGWKHPWRRTLYAVLTLTFFPLIVAPSATVPCNALLAGWLLAVAGWCLARFLLRRPRLGTAVPFACGAMLFWVAPAGAAPGPTPAPASSPEMVIVPYDATRPVAGQTPTTFYLPYERFLLLWDAAKRHRRPPTPEPPPGGERYTLGTARYDARLNGDTLEIDAALDLQTFGADWVGVPLRFELDRVGTVTLDGAPAALGGDGVLWIGKPGGHHVGISLRLPMLTVGAGTHVSWSVPPTAATLVTLLVPRADLRAELHGSAPDAGVVEETIPEGRRLTASLGGTTVELTFRDAPVPAPTAQQPALANVDARLTTSARTESLDAEIRFSFPGNTQDRFTVFLDPSLTMTGLDAPDIREWHLTTTGERQTLAVALTAPVHDGYRLALSADRPVGPLPAARHTFPLLSALATRVEQTASLLTEGVVEISLPDGPPAGARRVVTAKPERGRVFAAFAGDGTTSVVYSVRGAVEKRLAHVDYLYQVAREKIELAASMRLAPAAGSQGLGTVDLRLPTGFAVQAVVSEAVQQWWRDGDVLSLRFRPGNGQAEIPLVVYLVRQFERAPERFTLQPLVAVGFTETDGETVVAADGSFKVGLTLPTGVHAAELSEINVGTAAREFQVKAPLVRQRAFRYRGAEFGVTMTLESQPARWLAQWVTQATARDGAVALETHVNATMIQGTVDALEFSLPDSLNEARVSGPEVRETTISGTDGGRRTYRVLFQNPVYAGREAVFTISLELPLDANNRTSLPDLVLPGEGGRKAGGFVLVENASSGEMTLDPQGLEPAIEKDVPFLPPVIVAGTRFFRAAPGSAWSLGLRVTSLEKTAGRAALVAYAALTATLRANGEEWHRATYRLQNRRLQFLPVELPAGTELIGARVANESVRVDAGPVEKGAAPLLLVPLAQDAAGRDVVRCGIDLPPARVGTGGRFGRAVLRTLALGRPAPARRAGGENSLGRVPARRRAAVERRRQPRTCRRGAVGDRKTGKRALRPARPVRHLPLGRCEQRGAPTRVGQLSIARFPGDSTGEREIC